MHYSYCISVILSITLSLNDYNYHYFMITPLPLPLPSSWNNYHYHYLQIYHQQLLVNVPNYHYKNSKSITQLLTIKQPIFYLLEMSLSQQWDKNMLGHHLTLPVTCNTSHFNNTFTTYISIIYVLLLLSTN